MTHFRLGINTCFAVKRWPEAARWADIVRARLGLDIVQHSLDLVDLAVGPNLRDRQAHEVRQACVDYGLDLHSTFTGLAAYSSNQLLHPNRGLRVAAETFFLRAIDFTAACGGRGTGGHVGAYSAASWKDPASRRSLSHDLTMSLDRLTSHARTVRLAAFYIENMAAHREPATMFEVGTLLTEGDETHVPIRLCLDVGHQCVPGTTGEERDPYAWLRHFGAMAPAIHLQQSDETGDHHWPFTPQTNAIGRIDARRVLDALRSSGAQALILLLEVIPPFEADDDSVLDGLAQSVDYWKEAIASGEDDSVVPPPPQHRAHPPL